ncbi:MAG: response regulator [Tatlockia sp.]|nr:response regulator [Tatlockia sp.]
MEKKHILLVEDNKIAAKIAKQFLIILGCEVDDVDDGEKAIALALANHYDGVCLDIGLPTISGVEACKAIRTYEAQNHLKPVPIVALTGSCDPDEIALYLAAGIQEVLTKPFTKEKAERFVSLCN